MNEMERLELKLLRISEMRWSDVNYCDNEENRIYISRAPNFSKSKYRTGEREEEQIKYFNTQVTTLIENTTKKSL